MLFLLEALIFPFFSEGNDILGPTLSETRPEALPPPSSNETPAVPDSKEKKNAAKKKCLYNFQDAFMEANKVVMATSSATSSVSCTATTVQSSNSQFRVSSKRPPSLGKAHQPTGTLGVGAAYSLLLPQQLCNSLSLGLARDVSVINT